MGPEDGCPKILGGNLQGNQKGTEPVKTTADRVGGDYASKLLGGTEGGTATGTAEGTHGLAKMRDVKILIGRVRTSELTYKGFLAR